MRFFGTDVITKLLDRLEFCRAVFETTFSHRGRPINICLICEASLSHHTLCMGNYSSGSNNRICMWVIPCQITYIFENFSMTDLEFANLL